MNGKKRCNPQQEFVNEFLLYFVFYLSYFIVEKCETRKIKGKNCLLMSLRKEEFVCVFRVSSNYIFPVYNFFCVVVVEISVAMNSIMIMLIMTNNNNVIFSFHYCKSSTTDFIFFFFISFSSKDLKEFVSTGKLFYTELFKKKKKKKTQNNLYVMFIFVLSFGGSSIF